VIAVVVLAVAPALAERPALEPATATPASTTAFEPGESLTFSLHYLGMNVGQFKAEVGTREVDDRVLWPIETRGATEGFIRAVHKLDDRFTSLFDPALGRSIASEHDQTTGDYWQHEESRINGTRAWVHTRKQGEDYAYFKDVPAGAQDIVSAVYSVRSRTLVPGDTFAIPVFTTRKTWTLHGRVLRRERLETALGTLPVVAIALRTEFAGKLQADSELTLWMTDDARHLPARLDASFVFGSVSARLVDHRDGLLARR